MVDIIIIHEYYNKFALKFDKKERTLIAQSTVDIDQ